MIHKVKINKKYPFKHMRPGDTFKLDDDDIRSAQKTARLTFRAPLRSCLGMNYP